MSLSNSITENPTTNSVICFHWNSFRFLIFRHAIAQIWRAARITIKRHYYSHVKPNVAAACLLAPLKTSLVDVWSDDNSVYRLLTTSDFHYAINISILNRNDFVSLMSMRFPEEWRDLPEVQWDGFNLISSEWVAKLWHFILSTSDPEHETSFVEPFVNSLHILPAFISDEKRTLMKVANNMNIICPVKLISNLDTIVNQICDVSKQVGC